MSEWTGELSLKAESDIVIARRSIRDAATHLGFTATDVTRIVTAASELARNVFKYAGTGEMHWRTIWLNELPGIEIKFVDQGPGIENVTLALTEGYSTGRGLGMGLPGAKRLMHELEIETQIGNGTTVTMRRWRRS